MEEPVNGIRNTFFRDLIKDYLENQRKSFLYRDFWGEKMQELLEEHFPELLRQEPPKPKDAKQLIKGMCGAMKARPEWARGLLLKEDEKRRNIFEELWLNGAGYRAGIITDTEYYLWLTEYLAAHDFFKAGILYSDEDSDKDSDKVERKKTIHGHLWVIPLLMEGLDMDFEKLKEEIKARKNTNDKDEKDLSNEKTTARKKTQARKKDPPNSDTKIALAMLVEQIREDREGVAGRLHNLKYKGEDYLPWLNERLKWLALHIDIREWLRNRGFPLTLGDETDKPKKARNKDVTWQRFVAFADSEEGYDFRRKNGRGWEWGDGVYCLDGDFCRLDTLPEQLGKLMDAHGKAQNEDDDEEPLTYFYLPLAVHLRSGCVFFLAGKSYYEDVYQDVKGKKGDELRAKYQATKARYCFDYLRQDQSPGAMGGSFRLTPSFHLNAGGSYWDMLEKFEDYCTRIGPGTPLHKLHKTNGERPAELPEEFRWAFELPENSPEPV